MTVLDTFYLLFKSNTSEAREGIKKLDQDISNLAAKGQKRTEEENKQLKELRRQRTQATQDIHDQAKATDSLSGSLIGLGLAAVSAYAGFEALKKVSTNAIELNLNLQKTRALTGQNAEEILAWDQAFQSLGVDKGIFTSWYTEYSQFLQGTGQDTKDILPDLIKLSDVLRALPDKEARARFQAIARAFHLPQDFLIPLLKGGDALTALVETMQKLNTNTEKSEEAARGFSAAWQKAGDALNGAITGSKWYANAVYSLTNLGNIITALFQGNFGEAFKLWRTTSANAPNNQAEATGTSVASNAPLGIRSNNPGNLQPGGREAVFPSLQAGIAAEQAQLRRYGGRGINTLAAIAANWPDKAHQSSWLAAVQKATGLGVNQLLDLSNPATLARVAMGINVAEGDAAANTAITGKNALSQADQSPLNASGGGGRNTSVSIGTVTVNTQATDAQGISAAIAGALSGQINAVISNHDDGIVK